MESRSKLKPIISKLKSVSPLTWVWLAIAVGIVLRVIWIPDMEYKEDEQYMFDRLTHVGKDERWPWLGIPSTVYVRNPGMSVWVFLALGKLLSAQTPVGLCLGVIILNCLAISFLPWAIKHNIPKKEQEPWYWATALVSVNPFAILYHRKIWAQSVLPFFSLLLLLSWWKRDRKWGAFFWGLVGAAIGQVHMSGFFYAAGFVAWGALFDRKNIRWTPWFFGSCLGSLTLIPWILNFFGRPTGYPMLFGWSEAVQLKYWVFWITDPIGLHLGNPLGVSNGNGVLAQLGDFFRYPMFGDLPTYGVAFAHLVLLALGIWILALRAYDLVKRRDRLFDLLTGRGSVTAITQNACLWGYGLIMTLATLVVHRFYLIITFPLEFVWIARGALKDPKTGRACLGALFFAQLFVSMQFLSYIHTHQGSMQGDYGMSYGAQTDVFTRPSTKP